MACGSSMVSTSLPFVKLGDASDAPPSLPVFSFTFSCNTDARIVPMPQVHLPCGHMYIQHPRDINHYLAINNIVPIGTKNVGVFVDDARHRRQEIQEVLFALTPQDLNHHVMVVGQTGSGKTTMLKNLVISRIHHGEGVCVVDPHGDVTEELLSFIPGHRLSDVIYINLSDISYGSVGINVVEKTPPDEQNFKVQDILEALAGYFSDSWGRRMHWILTNALLAHVSIENSTLLGVNLMLHNDKYRAWVVKHCANPVARAFWTEEFPKHKKAFQQEAIAPIQNKLGPLLAFPHVQNMFGQVASTIDFRWAIDHNRIIIIRLAKGIIGEENANLIGSILVSLITKAALSRADIPEEERKRFTVVVDEAHTFDKLFTNSFADLRKYGLNLVVASQRFGKFRAEVRDDILSNVGTIVAYAVGPDDAELLSRHFPRDAYDRPWDPYEFRELPQYHCAVAGRHGLSDVLKTIPPLDAPFRHDLVAQVLQETRERYMRPRGEIQGKLNRWRETWREGGKS
jgi:energy-coupling factor transporter ATP-binding protein EcfA2